MLKPLQLFSSYSQDEMSSLKCDRRSKVFYKSPLNVTAYTLIFHKLFQRFLVYTFIIVAYFSKYHWWMRTYTPAFSTSVTLDIPFPAPFVAVHWKYPSLSSLSSRTPFCTFTPPRLGSRGCPLKIQSYLKWSQLWYEFESELNRGSLKTCRIIVVQCQHKPPSVWNNSKIKMGTKRWNGSEKAGKEIVESSLNVGNRSIGPSCGYFIDIRYCISIHENLIWWVGNHSSIQSHNMPFKDNHLMRCGAVWWHRCDIPNLSSGDPSATHCSRTCLKCLYT